MKVYRCLYDKEELKLFQNNIISSTLSFNDYSDITLNTHDYGITDEGFDKKIKRDRIHFFLFKEDAIDYLNNYIGYECFIGEYEIPDYLVLPNIGIGIYTENENKFALETAIPFGHILRDVNYEQYLVYYDLYRYNRLNIKYLNWKIELEKKYKISRTPSKLVECNYPVKLLQKDEIIPSLHYEIFNLFKEYKNIFKLLGLKSDANNNTVKFKRIKEPNLKEIRDLLIEYNLIEKNNKQKRK